MIKLKSGITACPQCGNDDEFYIKARVSGTLKINHTFSGGEADNTHLWDPAKLTNKNNAYCRHCNSDLGGWIEE